MSSFVIGKAEYIKAAGVIAGIAEEEESNPVPRFYVYDYQRGRKMTGADFYDAFCECFQMNAISVSEQYKDNEIYTDSDYYLGLYERAKKAGKAAARDPEKLKRTVYDLADFLQSAEYQTEKEAYFFKMKMIFNEILVQLFGLLWPHECECWGEFTVV